MGLVRRIYDEIRTSPVTRSIAIARVQLLNGGSWNNPINFYVRVQGSADTAYGSIRATPRNIDPTLPIIYFRTVDEQVRRSLNT